MKTTRIQWKRPEKHPINNLEVKIVVNKAICHHHKLNSVSTVGDDRLHFLAGWASELGGIPAF